MWSDPDVSKKLDLPLNRPCGRPEISGSPSEHGPDRMGLRIRIGVISPDDGINDDEYHSYLPPGVTLLWTRYRTPQRDDPISVDMVAGYGDPFLIQDAAETLRITRPHVTVFCCNSCSFTIGSKGDEAIRRCIAVATGGLATSITHAQTEALRLLGAKRVAIVAPYPREVTQKLRDYLDDLGFTVTASCSKEFTTEWQIGNSPSSVWFDMAREADSPEAEALVLACGGIRISDRIQELESVLNKPVVAAPAVAVWHALRLAGVRTPVEGRGRLFAIQG